MMLTSMNLISMEVPMGHKPTERMITAPNAGITLLYKGQYTPSEHVVHNTAMFPMTAATCYLMPTSAATKVPACNNYTIHTRRKRLLTDVISITASAIATTTATAAMGTATASIILSKNLEKKVNELRGNMQEMSNRLKVGEARMAQFETNQIRLGTILQNSQRILNSTINVVNQHSTTLETHDKQLNKHQQIILNIQHHLMQSEQDTMNRFLYLAIHDIYNNRPTLSFLHPADMHMVITNILQENNITVSKVAEQLPIAELITRLIIGQQVDFVPVELYSNATGLEIGKLMFTTFYAMPNNQKSNFEVYKIFTGPFIHHNKVVRLAQMPSYVGISKKDNSSITWTNDDISTCIFDLITTCRETPAVKQLEHENMCLAQILSGSQLKHCRTEQAKVSFPHIQQLRNGRWMISTNNTVLHCIRTATQAEPGTKTTIWSENQEVTIPPVAIVSVPNGTTIYCPGFNLPGPITPDSKSIINIIKNLSTAESMNEIIDMHQELVSNGTWEKLPYLNGDIDTLFQEMLSQTTQKNVNNNSLPWHIQHAGKLLMIILSTITVLASIIIFLIWRTRRIPANRITIALPSINI